MTSFTAACITLRTGRDPIANRDMVADLVRRAAADGAAFIQTPEMTNILERDRPLLFEKITAEEDDATLAALREVARQAQVVVQVGSLAVKAGERLANRAVLIGPDGDILAHYDKLHMFDVDLPNGESWRESRTYQPGHLAVAGDTPLARIGLTICYDVRFPALYRALAEAGSVILTAPACFTRQTGEAHWHVLQRARAIETGSFMISAAQAGTHEDGRETFGHSVIVDPWGRVLADGGVETGVTMATIDLAEVDAARARIPALRNARPFTVDLQGRAPLMQRPLAAAE